MNKDILIQLFKAPYKRQAFIDNALLSTFQGKVSNLKIYDEQGVQPIELTASEQDYAVSAVKYGEFQTLDEIPRTVELYEILVKDNKQIERSRVGLGALVKKHIIGNNAVLANFAYENPEKRTWRFSFIARDGVFKDGEMQIKDTPPKRYTYVFGEPEETYKTALDRFFVLGNELEITINKIKDAFGVEAMSKAFFDEYRDVHYAGFVDYLMRSNFQKSVFNGKDKDVRDFVKKLLGRIVFLYFLQKKGWLGATNTAYKDGDKNFMTHFFEKAGANDAFYPVWLSKLFFDALNSERSNDDFTMPDGEVLKIPYLNGGLFEKESKQYDFLTFPAGLFANLFEFFDQYNFTIFEDSPEEHTVAVDPEMLGHIFENLLEDNKDKGAFYTPKEIVHYMTQESLIEYLHIHIPDSDRTELENFVKNKDSQLSKEQKQLIDQKLDTVKICDPAIGSGAFPMGLLQEIFGLKERIAYELGYKVWSPATVKENIIQKSIYGVDIERGAVDIARLRFWLSLIVDEEIPKALPNLDYKIVVGNSLVSKFDDTVIEIDWDRKGSVGEADKHVKGLQNALKAISEKQKQFFESKSNQQKDKLKAEIRDLKLDVLSNQLSFNKAAYLNKNQKVSDLGFGLKATDHKKNIEVDLQIAEYDEALAKLKRLKENPAQPFNHFDWKLDFPEVLNHLVIEEIGFDIVIGNPPYLRIQGIRDIDSNLADVINKKYKSATGSYDLYAVFTEKSVALTQKNGVLNFIMPVKWTNAAFGKGLRQVINKDKSLLKIINFGAHQVFNASTYTGLHWFRQDSLNASYVELDKELKTPSELENYLKHLSDSSFAKYPAEKLTESPWVLTDTKASEILGKIAKHKRKLSDVFDKIFQGIATSKDSVYFLYDCKVIGDFVEGFSKELNERVIIEKGILKPLLKGDDVHRYCNIKTDKWVIFPYVWLNGKIELIKEYVLSKSYPSAYQYLKKNENILREREKGRFNIEKEWFQYGRKQGILLAEKEKLIAPDISMGGNFSYDEEGGFYSTTTNYGYILKPGIKEGYKFYLSLLNSKVLWWYLVNTGSVLANGYFRFKPDYLKPFPIPDIKNESSVKLLAFIASFVLLVHKITVKLNPTIPNTHIAEAFEEVIDALVFELYFPEDFAEKGIEIEKYAQAIFKPVEGLSEEEQIKAIQETYQTLREKDNPLRNQIKLMKIELKELLLPILSV
jgi:hypothetical protein